MVYLRDHVGASITSNGALGEVTLLSGSAKQVLPLAPSGDNALLAEGSYQAAAGSKAVLGVCRDKGILGHSFCK